MRYEVGFHTGALRDFDKLTESQQKRIRQAIDNLAEQPRPPGSAKLAGMDAYRVRVGDYRVAYVIRDDRLIVLILRIGHRRDIYRDMEIIRQRLKQ